MINLPLLALFGMAYGLGHPELAAVRPVSVDKTLASFHADVNCTMSNLSQSAGRLVAKGSLMVRNSGVNVQGAAKTASTEAPPAFSMPKRVEPQKVETIPVAPVKIEELKPPKLGFKELRGS